MVATSLIFAHPWVLWALPLLAVGGWGFWKFARRYAEKRVALFVSAGLLKEAVTALSGWQRLARFFLPVAILMLLAIALARPLVGPKPGHAERKGVDFVVALDVSRSMWTEDVAPDRLDAVKKELTEWLKSNAGDRMGLILFAGDAVIQAPVTADFQALTRVLKGASPKNLSKGGTNISEAIALASSLLKRDDLDSKALVIISDGEDLDGDAIAAAREAHAKDGISIFTIGVGTEAGGRIPTNNYAEHAKNPTYTRYYVRNEYGSEVTSRRDEQALQRIAQAGGGRYEAFTSDGQFFPKFRDNYLLPLARERKILNAQDYYEWFQLPLALAILLLMLEPLIRHPRKASAPRKVGVAVTSPTSAASPAGTPVKFVAKVARPAVKLLVLALWLSAASGFADTRQLQQQVDQLITEKRAPEAVALMREEVRRQPANLELRYNFGLVLYQAEQYEEAASVFQDVKLASEDDALRAKVLFQLGNAQFRLGRKLGTQPAAVLSLERAMAFYDELIALRSTSDVTRNREVTEQGLKDVLKEIAASRLRAVDAQIKKNELGAVSRTLAEAVDALEKLTTLDPKDQQVAAELVQVKQRLADSLMKDAERHIAETDKIEARNNKNDDRQVLGRREQAIALQQQALAQTPNDPKITEAIQQQQSRMADLLTRRAEEKVTPALAKEKLDGGAVDALSKGRKELSDALELDPNNSKAHNLKSQAETKLTDHLLSEGERALAQAEKPADARNRLRSAVAALDSFQRAEEISPDNDRTKKGLEKVEAILPELHAAAAKLDLAEAKKLLQPADEAKSQENLKKAVGALETATQNFNRALSLKPDEAEFQTGAAEAQKLLSESRDDLDKQRQSQASNEPPPESPSSADSSDSAQSAPDSRVYSQMPKPGKASPSSSESFWNRRKRDW